MTKPVLDNWSLVASVDNPYQPPELADHKAKGLVYGHPSFTDGQSIITSRIVGFDYPNKEITTQKRTYTLGTIDPNYATWLRGSDIIPKTFDIEDFDIEDFE